MIEASIFRSPVATPSIYRLPFQPRAAYEQLPRRWLWSPFFQRYFFALFPRRLPSALWPRPTFAAVVEALADVLIADVQARRGQGRQL
jgi:hypothetical protein